MSLLKQLDKTDKGLLLMGLLIGVYVLLHVTGNSIEIDKAINFLADIELRRFQ
ncbi:hypothetical protein [Bacillus toyonensis]|uniref:hypothetical protein n=1 Tax=Bacillus toyonensis TaxID=155322 RepID=UPI00159BD5B2|nr:hypothetical protein [Bacillus toyonensis]